MYFEYSNVWGAKTVTVARYQCMSELTRDETNAELLVFLDACDTHLRSIRYRRYISPTLFVVPCFRTLWYRIQLRMLSLNFREPNDDERLWLVIDSNESTVVGFFYADNTYGFTDEIHLADTSNMPYIPSTVLIAR